MARGKDRLTALQVKAAKPAPTPSGMRLLGDGNGLALQINRSGKSWLYRWMDQGKPKAMGLGPCPPVTLADARLAAIEAGRWRYKGIDPREARRDERKAKAAVKTFDECAEKYHTAHLAEWTSKKNAAQWLATVTRFASPHIGDMDVAKIGLADVLRVLEPEWVTKYPTMSRLRGRLELILGYAASHGWRDANNPATWDVLRHTLANIDHVEKQRRAMPYSEVPAFYAELRQHDDPAALALRLLVLTSTRSGEVRGAQREEFDLAASTWTIPAQRTKQRATHVVPLAPAAVALVAALPRNGDLLFPTLKEPDLRAVLVALGHDDIDVHGFRTSMSDWGTEITKHADMVIETSLAHHVGGKVRKAYKLGTLLTKRRNLAIDWANFCSGETLQLP